MSTSIKRQTEQMARIDEPLPDRPMDKDAPLLTPEEEAAYMEALAYQQKVVEERFKAPPPKDWSLPLWAQAICVAVLLGLLFSPRPWWGNAPSPKAVDVAQGTRMQVWLMAQELERARAATGAAPRPRVTGSSGQRLTIILDGIPRTISAGVPATR